MDERTIVTHLRALRGTPEAQRAFLSTIWDRQSARVQKAAWTYSTTLEHVGLKPANAPSFVEQYVKTCHRNALLVAEACDENLPRCDFAVADRTLYICWHFCDFPLAGRFIMSSSGTALIARSSMTTDSLERQGACLNFRKPDFAVRLARLLKSGKPIMAMFDYCYPESRALPLWFLGRECRTPTGILHLAMRFDYAVEIIVPGETSIQSLPVANDGHVEPLAADLNAKLEAEILARPAEWMMWPALDQRWS